MSRPNNSLLHTRMNALRGNIKTLLKKSASLFALAKVLGLISKPATIDYTYKRLELSEPGGLDFRRRQLQNLMNYCKETGSSDYSFEAGYQSVIFQGQLIQGRRDPSIRLRTINYDFKGKSVLDIGCNQGGMLFALANDIQSGVGIDYEPRVINVCHAIRSANKLTNLDFYVHDLDKDPLENILDFIPNQRLDVTLLLAVSQHIRIWRELIYFVKGFSKTLIFETNGTFEGQAEQVTALRKNFKSCQQCYSTSPDDGAQRSLWIAEN